MFGIFTCFNFPDRMKASRFSKYRCSTPASANILNSSPNTWSMAPIRMQNSVVMRRAFVDTHPPSWNSLIQSSIFSFIKSFILYLSSSSLFYLASGRPASPTILPLKISRAVLSTLSQSSGLVLLIKSKYSSQWIKFFCPI